MMTHLRLRTEASFHYAAGKMDDVVSCLSSDVAPVTDRNGTWGHVKWQAACKKANKHPVFGVELAVVKDMDLREKQHVNYMAFLARSEAGLRELYELTTLASEKFYYHPRLEYSYLSELSDNLIILGGAKPEWELVPKKLKSFYVEMSPIAPPMTPIKGKVNGYPVVATGDNLFPRPADREFYEIILGRDRQMRTAPSHILSAWEWLSEFPGQQQALDLANKLGQECKGVKLPTAKLIHPEVDKTLRQMCYDGAKVRGLSLKDYKYIDRLETELALIEKKQFEDYFFVVADMITWAKERMFVGPARGSSCGSLVCYLIGITDIDPLPYDLLFERFIDINREDYPDIDIDFQHDRRELVFDYLREKYGHTQVNRLGTINVYKAKSALGDCAKEMQIPLWEISDLKNAIIERSTGDSRAAFCIMDTFQDLEIGRKTLEKYPELKVSAKMEGHASHAGMHAAGILVTADPITHYCAVDLHAGTVMLDKYDAEKLNLLKIDALGLRQLTVLQDTLDQIGWSRDKLKAHRLDDEKAFAVLNESHFAGIFQFEGYALQSITKQMVVDTIEDIIAITALARPGPLSSGGTGEFVKRRTGKSEIEYLHPLVQPITEVSFGVIVYQEQVMQIAREVGALSWADVSSLRKAMSKSLGEEYFDQFWEKFWEGAQHKMSRDEARHIWDHINTMGSWAFNRSHAVAYGMMSYWCCVLKAHFPLEFAASCLRNAKDDDQSIKILRELVVEGYSYRPYDAKTSVTNWSVQAGVLVGGLTAIKGVGVKLADSIIRKRAAGTPLTKREETLLATGTTPWDKVFECADLWGHVLANPGKYGIESEVVTLADITQESDGTFVFLAKVKEKNLRDQNELQNLVKRGGRRVSGNSLFLNLTLEDDTSSIIASINRHDYERLGMPIVEEGKIGDWFIWKGRNRGGFRRVQVQRWKKLTGAEEFTKPTKKLKKVVAATDLSSETGVAIEPITGSKKTIKPKSKRPK